MHWVRASAVGLMVIASLAIAGLVAAPPARAADPEPELTATLDGRPIPLEEVGKHYCDDFSYPEIRCWSTRLLADSRATLVTLLTAIDYVTVWDGANFGGSFLNASQDYSALTLIGWNDRISSFKGRNSETGAFFTDWFYSGTTWAFCCNTQATSLGSFNNTFSSIIRT